MEHCMKRMMKETPQAILGALELQTGAAAVLHLSVSQVTEK